tara:strand:+ start:1522 stop:1848 length:327 start_codon:yes stop_codon:yes gene_type:complete
MNWKKILKNKQFDRYEPSNPHRAEHADAMSDTYDHYEPKTKETRKFTDKLYELSAERDKDLMPTKEEIEHFLRTGEYDDSGYKAAKKKWDNRDIMREAVEFSGLGDLE